MGVDFSLQRLRMVDGQVRTTDVTVPALLDIMGIVPRERFVDAGRSELAYIDEDIQIAPARDGNAPRYMMQASPFAKLAQLAEIGPEDVVLDVGCGTGYSTAVISRLAKSVVALESDAELAERASSALADLGYANVTVVTGPLPEGSASNGPYDVIFVGGSVDSTPVSLLDQLKEGGRLVVVEGQGNAGRAKRYLKSEGATTGRHVFNAAIKPLPGFERAYTFQF